MKKEDIWQTILNVITENDILDDIYTFSMNDKLSDVGFNSSKYIQMIVFLEETFSVEINDEALLMQSFPTFADLVEYFESKIQND